MNGQIIWKPPTAFKLGCHIHKFTDCLVPLITCTVMLCTVMLFCCEYWLIVYSLFCFVFVPQGYLHCSNPSTWRQVIVMWQCILHLTRYSEEQWVCACALEVKTCFSKEFVAHCVGFLLLLYIHYLRMFSCLGKVIIVFYCF